MTNFGVWESLNPPPEQQHEEFIMSLHLVNDKKEKIKELSYELELIKNDCVKKFKQRTSEISELVDFVDVFNTQPKKDALNIITSRKTKPFYLFTNLVNAKIFKPIANDVIIKLPLIAMSYGIKALELHFEYKNEEFMLQIPNINAIDDFNEISSYGYYQILKQQGSIRNVLASFFTIDEIKFAIKDILDEWIAKENLKKGE